MPYVATTARAVEINEKLTTIIKQGELSYIARAQRILALEGLAPEKVRTRLSRPPAMHSTYWRVVKIMSEKGMGSYQSHWLAGRVSPAAMEDIRMMHNAPMLAKEREEAVWEYITHHLSKHTEVGEIVAKKPPVRLTAGGEVIEDTSVEPDGACRRPSRTFGKQGVRRESKATE